MKRRKREFGLFCILGMGKKHLAFVLFWEVFRSMLISLLAGIAGGILFSQLMFLLLLKFVGLPGKLVFRIPFQSVGETKMCIRDRLNTVLSQIHQVSGN